MFSYTFGEEEPTLWRPPQVFPQRILDHVAAGGYIEAHNAMFELAIWYNILHKRSGLPMPTRWRDTMAVCAYRSLPMKLDLVGTVLDLDVQKDARGKQLIKLLTQPQKKPKLPVEKLTKKGVPTATYVRQLEKYQAWKEWIEDEDLMVEFGEYCKTDTKTERALRKRVGFLPVAEQEVWALDMIINKRGVAVDVEGIKAAISLMDNLEEHGTATLKHITNEKVTSGGEIDKILAFCAEHDEHLPDLTADTVEEWLERRDLPEVVRKVLELRQLLSKASAKKLQRMLDWMCEDGRIRGMLQYHGSGTGRWAGRGPQPQNFPRGDEEILKLGMEVLMDAIKLADINALGMFYGDDKIADAVASSLRGMFIAGPGKDFIVGDLSAIEARVAAWVSGEQWKLDAFAAIDRGEGYKGSADIYLATASGVYGYPCLTKETHKAERQTGKTCELAFGYQGGVGAWRKFDSSDKWTDEEIQEKKHAWRDAHPNLVEFWYEIEKAAVACVKHGRPTHYRTIGFEMVHDAAGRWLTIILPNKRRLWYFSPRLFTNDKGRLQLEYAGRDNKKAGVWNWHVRTYGGMLTENIVQAISRDIMVEGMFRLERAGYWIVLTVHDEIVSEVDIGFGSEEEFEAIMAQCPKWTPGLPLAVGTFRKRRYEK